MNKQEYIDSAEQELLHTYNRFSLVLDHGKDVYLYAQSHAEPYARRGTGIRYRLLPVLCTHCIEGADL